MADVQETQTSPEGVLLTLSAKALEMVKETREQEGVDSSYGLRVAVRGGGCGGFMYALDFENEERPFDRVLTQDDLKIYVDQVSARYVQGAEIDYKLGIHGAGFLFKNLTAVGTCGCGSSAPM